MHAAGLPTQDLLGQFDYTNPEHDAHVDEVLSYARGHCPMAHTSASGGYYIATTYDAVADVLRHHETVSSAEYVNIAGSMGVRQPPLDADPPLQHDFRKIINPFFHPKVLARNEQDVRELARAHIRHWVSDGRCEFITGFASPFVTDEDADELARRAQQFQGIQIVQNSGHSVQSDQPRALIEILRGVLAG